MSGKDLTKESFRLAYPAIYEEILREGEKAARADIDTSIAQAREEGAAQERERIRSVESQLVPGHEALIGELKYDGKTSGPEAAVQVLQAEKDLRKKKTDEFDDGGSEHIAGAATETVENGGKPKRVEKDARKEVDRRAREKKDELGCSYSKALEAVFKEDPDLKKEYEGRA